MDYIKEVLPASFWDAWNLVFERSLPSSVVAVIIFLISLWFLRHRRRTEEAKVRLKEFGEAALITGAVFLVIWAAFFTVFTPKRLLADTRAATVACNREKGIALKERDTAKADADSARSKSGGFQSEAQLSQRRETVRTLSMLLSEGSKLEHRFQDNSDFPAVGDLNNWSDRVIAALNSPSLGEAYIARFNSSDSQPGLEGITIVGHTWEESARWKWVKKRNATLRDFIRELSTQ